MATYVPLLKNIEQENTRKETDIGEIYISCLPFLVNHSFISAQTVMKRTRKNESEEKEEQEDSDEQEDADDDEQEDDAPTVNPWEGVQTKQHKKFNAGRTSSSLCVEH